MSHSLSDHKQFAVLLQVRKSRAREGMLRVGYIDNRPDTVVVVYAATAKKAENQVKKDVRYRDFDVLRAIPFLNDAAAVAVFLSAREEEETEALASAEKPAWKAELE